MTTILEYLLTHYLGKPRRWNNEGVSYWSCPVCGHESFHTMPDKPGLKHRAKCWNSECGIRGDAADMLKEFHPDTTYSERIDRLDQLERQFTALKKSRTRFLAGSKKGGRNAKAK